MSIDTKIQNDFSSLVFYSTSEASFSTAKATLVDDIQDALSVATDDETKNGLELLLSVVDGWTFDPPAPAAAPLPPSQQTLEDLEDASTFVATDMEEIFALIRQVSAETRRFMQEESLAMQSEELSAAQDQYNTAINEATQRFSQSMSNAIGEIVGGVVSAGFSIGGMAWSAKGATAFKESQKANEATEVEQAQLNTKEGNRDGVGDDQENARLKIDSTRPTSLTEKEDVPVLAQREKQLMNELDALDQEAAGLRSEITKQKTTVADARRKENNFNFQREKFTQRATNLGGLGQSLNTILGGVGRLTGTTMQQQADLDRALVDRTAHYISVMDTVEKAFDQFMQTARQAMSDSVAQFKDVMNSQAQLSEHLGQNVGA